MLTIDEVLAMELEIKNAINWKIEQKRDESLKELMELVKQNEVLESNINSHPDH